MGVIIDRIRPHKPKLNSFRAKKTVLQTKNKQNTPLSPLKVTSRAYSTTLGHLFRSGESNDNRSIPDIIQKFYTLDEHCKFLSEDEWNTVVN